MSLVSRTDDSRLFNLSETPQTGLALKCPAGSAWRSHPSPAPPDLALVVSHTPNSLFLPVQSISFPACASSPDHSEPSYVHISAMSFLVQSQRGYEQVPQQDLAELSVQNQNQTHSRIHQMPSSSPSSYPEYPSQSLSSQPNCTPQLQNSPNPQSFALDHSNSNLPKVGETRCYWSLLSAELNFIYTDPVLTSHLCEQADSIVGKSLLTFVHPDEQASAKHDLGSVLESRILHGSVTRVRFLRLSKVRRELGFQGAISPWPDAEKVVVDANYMAVDIVINWAAEGLVLCFIHAVVDLTPDDNDELNKTGWSNWCGTTGMTHEQVQLLYRRLLMCIPQSGNITRVFQILSNQQGRQLLISWPPDHGHGHGPTGRDFAKLVADVQIGTGTQDQNAKTSCTRRYKALQTMPTVMGEVESVFTPHGTVIFACHKVNPPSRASATTAAPIQHMGYGPNTYVPQSSHQQYYEHGAHYVLSSPQYSSYLPQQSQHDPAQYSPHWSSGSEPSTSHQQQYHSWSSPSPSHSTSPLPPAVSHLRSGSYPPPQNQQWPSQPAPYLEPATAVSDGSPTYAYSTTSTASESASPLSPVNATVPPPRRRVSPGTTRDQYGPGGRSAGNRPVGVLKCSSCKATQSPEWRKGPSGKKELCNACGLRYARSRAKKEGHNLTTQRRRKDKGLAAAKRESVTPPVSGSPSYTSTRRGGYDSSFSAGSVSGSEAYTGHQGLDTLTPSPSPPASSVNFVHYSPHPQSQPADVRQPYTPASGSFYSVTSPLSNPPVMHSQEDMSTYPERMSPMLSSASSPLTSTVPPASFERERDRERELPPTPVSAEPRHQTRR